MTRIRLPELGFTEAGYLWFSLQRYALLLTALALAPLLLVGLWMPGVWWAWLLALPIAGRIGGFAVAVWRRWPAKRHALRVALFRVAAGRFEPEQIRRHCGDPCFRLVAHACLRRAGVAAGERRRIVAVYAAQLREASSELLIFDHVRGEVQRLTSGHVTTSPLLNPSFRSQSSIDPSTNVQAT